MADVVRAPEKRYLGDGVYIAPGSYPGEFILTTEDGISVQNTIALDASIVQGIARFLDHTVAYIAQQHTRPDDAPATLPPGQEALSTEDKATLRQYMKDKGLPIPEGLE